MKKVLLAFICALAFIPITYAQEDDLLSLLGEEETTDYANAAFKTNRVINLHSLENTAAGVFDFYASYRFKLGDFNCLLNGKIDNVFDQTYIADAADGDDHTWKTAKVFYGFGRTWSMGLKLMF